MNILVVDDDARLCRAVVDELTRLGHEATPAYSAKAALEILFSENIDILVTDLRMSGKDGIELIDLARGASPQTRTLLMSAYATAQDYKSAIAMGAVDVLTKPFTPKDLEQAIQKATDCLEGYHGNIHGLSLPDILQAFGLARSSITVHVGTHGIVHVLKGDVIHAELGDHQGLDAFRDILNNRSGRVHTSPSRDGVPRTIEGRLDHLLIALQAEADTPDPTKKAPLPVSAAPAKPAPAPMPPPARTASPAAPMPPPLMPPAAPTGGRDTASTLVERVEATNLDPAEPFLPDSDFVEVTPEPEAKKKRGLWIGFAAAAAILLAVFVLWPGSEPVERAAIEDEVPVPSEASAALDERTAPPAVPTPPPAVDDDAAPSDDVVEPATADAPERTRATKKVRRRRRVTRADEVDTRDDVEEADDDVDEEPTPPKTEATTAPPPPPPAIPIIQDTKPRLDTLDDDKPRIGTLGDERPNVGTLED